MVYTVTLEIVTNRVLPMYLARLFPAPDEINSTEFYNIVKYTLNYLGDEHLTLLDRAYKAREIAHWGCSDGTSADTFNIV